MSANRIDASAVAELSRYIGLLNIHADNPDNVRKIAQICRNIMETAVSKAEFAIQSGEATGVVYVVQNQQVAAPVQPSLADVERNKEEAYRARAAAIGLNIDVFRISAANRRGYTRAQLSNFLKMTTSRSSGSKKELAYRLNTYLWTGVSQ